MSLPNGKGLSTGLLKVENTTQDSVLNFLQMRSFN
jgi:hypothetical protein